jgi:hypothetical protein
VKWLRWLSYQLSVPPRQQTCKDCWRNDGLDFYVPPATWNAVVKPEIRGYALDQTVVGEPYDREGWPGVLCLECFDRRAQARGIDYSGYVAVMGRKAWLATGEAMRRIRTATT